jgi:hypothetical protein
MFSQTMLKNKFKYRERQILCSVAPIDAAAWRRDNKETSG